MEEHEAARLFPLDEDTIPELAEDIRQRGLIEPIKVFAGKLIDGRRRLRACKIAGVEPRYEEVETDDPIALSWSLNGPRRGLTASQKGMVVAAMREMYAKQAKERQRASGGDKKSEAAKSVGPARGQPISADAGRTRDVLGELAGVGANTVDRATKVRKKGVPELVRAVEDGHMTVCKAARLADEDEATQRAAAAKAAAPPKREPRKKKEKDAPTPRPGGVGVSMASQAIDILKRIPKDDPQRNDAWKIVTDWARTHLKVKNV